MSVEMPSFHVIQGLAEASRKQDKTVFDSLLASVPDGETFGIDNMLLTLSEPTEEEQQLITRSVQEKREFGLVTCGTVSRWIEGETAGVLTSDATSILMELQEIGEEMVFTHSHWNSQAYTLPSPSDRVQSMIYWRRWPKLKCRIVFPFNEKTKVLTYLGEIEK